MRRSILASAVLVLVAYSVSAETVTDNFNDGVLGPAWEVVTQSGGASWEEAGGTLNVGGSAGQTGELVMRYNQALADMGSVRIDYNWISYSGHKARVGLGLFDSSWTGEEDEKIGVSIWGVRYEGAGLHAVNGSGTDAGYQIVYSVPTSGSLMIERNGNDFRARYLDGRNWQDLFQGYRDLTGTPVYPYLYTSNSNTNPSWEVALDNFHADVVPEPSTLALLAMGAAGVLLYALRRRK